MNKHNDCSDLCDGKTCEVCYVEHPEANKEVIEETTEETKSCDGDA